MKYWLAFAIAICVGFLITMFLDQLSMARSSSGPTRRYQIENKIRALVTYELARDIPLVR
jgi:hypothetical protein